MQVGRNRFVLRSLVVRSSWRAAGAADVSAPASTSTTFGVTVTDRKGNIVTDLTKDDFEVIEDGKPQAIEYFARGDGDDQPRRCTSA